MHLPSHTVAVLTGQRSEIRRLVVEISESLSNDNFSRTATDQTHAVFKMSQMHLTIDQFRTLLKLETKSLWAFTFFQCRGLGYSCGKCKALTLNPPSIGRSTALATFQSLLGLLTFRIDSKTSIVLQSEASIGTLSLHHFRGSFIRNGSQSSR